MQRVSLVPRLLFFFSCGGEEKKGSGGSPIHFLCSRIYNFWGSLISGDEQQRPVNKATIGNTAACTQAEPKAARTQADVRGIPIVASLTGLCCSSPLINDPQKL